MTEGAGGMMALVPGTEVAGEMMALVPGWPRLRRNDYWGFWPDAVARMAALGGGGLR